MRDFFCQKFLNQVDIIKIILYTQQMINSQDTYISRLNEIAGPDYWPGRDAGLPIMELYAQAKPLNFQFDDSLNDSPTLNLLIPGLAMHTMSGGPNTALNLIYRLALSGIPIRLISTCVGPDADLRPLLNHMMQLAETDIICSNIYVTDGSNRNRAVSIGKRDIFMATAWWTAQMAMCQLPLMNTSKFFYLIQDYEAILHPASSLQTMALETYNADMIPIVNHPILFNYFKGEKVGRFADAEFAENAMCFTPAVDSRIYRYQEKENSEIRKLLFYARPQTGIRNLFEIGSLALHVAAMRGVFDNHQWQIYGFGDAFNNIRLSANLELISMPKMGQEEYASKLRDADILLSLIMSPHPSYPPLEMAACGGLTVTNTFGIKTSAEFARFSQNIIVAEPAVESIVTAIATAVKMLEDKDRKPDTLKSHPDNWTDSFASLIPELTKRWNQLT